MIYFVSFEMSGLLSNQSINERRQNCCQGSSIHNRLTVLIEQLQVKEWYVKRNKEKEEKKNVEFICFSNTDLYIDMKNTRFYFCHVFRFILI